MATEDEIKDLREKNNELVQKVQYWKMTAGQRENEKLNLMKEINELRLKLGRYRNNSDVQARNLDAALQSAGEKSLSHLMLASNEIARMVEVTKKYMRDRQEPEASPRWSTISGTPAEKTEKVHRVPPMMMGGRSIQPVVALSRTIFNTSNSRSTSNVTHRAEPLHVLQARLQDAYIPLTRIDAELNSNMEIEMDAEDEADDSSENLGLEDSGEGLENSHNNISEVNEEYDISRLDTVAEDMEPENENQTPPRRIENPLEGPSWLLDKRNRRKPGALEPDSTTEIEPNIGASIGHEIPIPEQSHKSNLDVSSRSPCVFSPTVRRKRPARADSPVATPTMPPITPPRSSTGNRRNSISGRVLKVLVAKMHLEAEAPPTPKRPTPDSFVFDAPSPNGATFSGVIVSESTEMEEDAQAHGEPAPHVSHASRCDSRASTHSRDSHVSNDSNVSHISRGSRRQYSQDRDSDSGSGQETAGRSRRPRKKVEYKEKPLNRKMRR